MKFTFETEFINERAYRRVINRYILENFGKEMFQELRYDDIIIRPSDRIGEEPFFDGVGNGTGGVTGINEIRAYVYDTNDLGGIIFRANVSTICHELAHLCLLNSIIGYDRVMLNFDDYSGNKAGSIMNYATAEVHNRQMARKTYTAVNWLWTGSIYKRISYDVLDFRDHLDFQLV